MQLLGHRVTGGEAEFGVLGQYFDSELHLVDDSLSGSVAAREKFKILGSIIGSQTIDVVDCLVGQQFSSNLLLHDVSMFEHVGRRFGTGTGNDDSDIAPSAFVSRDLLLGVFFSVGQASEERPAFGTAQRFESIYGAAGPALDGHGFSALSAVDCPTFLRKSASDSSAFCGAVHRVFVELFAVFAQVSGFVKERFATNATLEFSSFGLRSWAAVRRFVRSFAGAPAEALLRMRRLDLKSGRALFTDSINRHFVLPLVVATTLGSTDVYVSKQETT